MSGECMAVGTVKERGKWRGVVVVGELTLPPTPPRFTTLFESHRCDTRQEAQRVAFVQFWPLYEQRHGFKHPEDPARTSFDLPPPADVVVMSRVA